MRASSCGGRRSRPSWCANQEGELEVKEQKLKLIKDRYPILGVPFIRGVVNFLASLVEGVKALMWSAEFYPDDQEEETPPSLSNGWKSASAAKGL